MANQNFLDAPGLASPDYQPGQPYINPLQMLVQATAAQTGVQPSYTMPDGTYLPQPGEDGTSPVSQLAQAPQAQQQTPQPQDNSPAVQQLAPLPTATAEHNAPVQDDGSPGIVDKLMAYATGGFAGLQKLNERSRVAQLAQTVYGDDPKAQAILSALPDERGVALIQQMQARQDQLQLRRDALNTKTDKPEFIPGMTGYVLGKDANGNPTAVSISGATGPAGIGIDPSLTGQEAIDALRQSNPAIARQAEAIVNLRQPQPPSTSRGPQAQFNQQVRDAVQQIDPTYDAKSYQTAQQVQNAASGKGAIAQKMLALHNMIEHGSNMVDTFSKLDNGDTPIINGPLNAVESLTGTGSAGPNLDAFNTQKQNFIDEMQKFYGDNSVSGIQEASKNINAAQSPDQFKNAVAAAMQNANSQLTGLQSQIKQGVGKFSPDVSVLSAQDIANAKDKLGVELTDPGTYDPKIGLFGNQTGTEQPNLVHVGNGTVVNPDKLAAAIAAKKAKKP